jgi:hypothetical protein
MLFGSRRQLESAHGMSRVKKRSEVVGATKLDRSPVHAGKLRAEVS